MIQFSCMYCGQPVSADEALVGEKIECPGCGHAVMVRPKRPARADEIERKPAEYWEGRSNREVLAWLRSKPLTPKQKRRLAARRALSRALVQYDDVTLFALSLAFVLLWAMNSQVGIDLSLVSVAPRIAALLGLALLGMVLSLLNIVVRHRKFEFEKRLMLLFAVLVTAGTGAYAGYVTLRGGWSWVVVFPAWNVLNSLILLSAFHEGLVNTGSLTDERAGLVDVIVTAVVISLLLALCNYSLNLHWSITYSIAVGYTVSLHRGVQSIFGRRGAD